MQLTKSEFGHLRIEADLSHAKTHESFDSLRSSTMWFGATAQTNQMNDSWTFVKLYPQKNNFWIPRREWNPQPSDDWWDALTIEIPRVRRWVKLQARHTYDLSWSHYMLLRLRVRRVWRIFYTSSRYLEMFSCQPKPLTVASILRVKLKGISIRSIFELG